MTSSFLDTRDRKDTTQLSGVFLYKENHALDAWFNKAYGGE